MLPERTDHHRPTEPRESDPWQVDRGTDHRPIEPTMGSRLVVFGLICFAVLVAVRFGSALLGDKVLAGTDILFTRFPWRTGVPYPSPQNALLGDSVDSTLPGYRQIFQNVWSGDFSLWSTFTGPGRALIAIGNLPTLTPVSIWWLLMPTAYAAGFVKFVQFIVAFAGMALWLRRTGASWTAGMFAGLLYVGSGFLTAWANWPGQSAVACLIPAVFWAVERFVGRRTVLAALPLALIIGFLVLGGFPAVAGHALYGAGLYFLVRLAAEIREHGWRNTLATLGLGIGAVVLGVGLAAVQLIPVLDRLGGISTEYRARQFYSQQPFRSLLSIFFPQTMNGAGYPHSNAIEGYAYVGMAAVALAAIAVVSVRYTGARRGVVTFLVIGTLLSAALAWQQGFWTDWMADLPAFSGNSSGRLRDMVTVFLCALAGIGLQTVLRTDLPRRARLRVLFVGGASFALLVICSVVVWQRYGHLLRHPAQMVQDVIAGLLATALVVVAIVLVRRPAARTAALGLLIAVTTVLSAMSTAFFYPAVDRQTFYPELPIVVATQDQVDNGRLLGIGGYPGSTAAANGMRTVTGHTFYPRPWSQLVRQLNRTAFHKVGGPTKPWLGTLTPESGKLTNPLLDRLAVNTVYASPGREIPGDVRLLNGRPAPAGSVSKDTTPLINRQPIELNIQAQPTRAIRIWLPDQVETKGGLTLTASIKDSGGGVLASGEVTKRRFEAGAVDIPLNGGEAIETATDTYTLTIDMKVRQPDNLPSVRLLAEGPSGPRVRLIGPVDDGLRLVYADDHGVVWERTTAMPRIRWADKAIVSVDRKARLARLVDPATPLDAVMLSKPGPQPSGQPATLTTLVDSGDEVSVQVDAKGSGYLVIADAIQEGFSATIDGRPAELVDADHAFGAVFVPEGSHLVTVTFTGSGMGVKAGVAISGASVVIIVVLALGGWWWNRRRRTGGTAPDDGPDSDGATARATAELNSPADALATTDRLPPTS